MIETLTEKHQSSLELSAIADSKSETKIFSAVKAIARGAWEAGVRLVTGYPGTPITGIFESAQKYNDITCQWAQNEKVAFEISAGAAFAGARTLVVMKHVGLNVAADPFYNIAYTGIEGGLVIIVGDDPGASSSQNEQDTRLVCQAAGIPVFEPSNVQESYLFTKMAFELSETYDTPIVIRITSQLCFTTERISIGIRKEVTREYKFARPLQKYLLIPKFVPENHIRRNSNLIKIQSDPFVNETYYIQSLPVTSNIKYELGIITTGTIFPLLKEIISDRYPILKIGMVYPISSSQIHAFSNHCEKILVAEESSNFLELQIRNLGIKTIHKKYFDGVGSFKLTHLLNDEVSSFNDLLKSYIKIEKQIFPIIDLQDRIPSFCSGCSHTGIFQVLKELNLYVVGDIGCNTLGALKPFNALHSNLCMGASIGMLHGYLSVMPEEANRKVVAVIGDSTFFHSGLTSLLTLVKQNSTGTIIILDNSGSAMTGLQKTNINFDENGWTALLTSMGVKDIHILHALDMPLLRERIIQCLEKDTLSVCVLLGECVQNKQKTIYRYTINDQLCTSCGKCLETNCPSFKIDKGKIEITDTCVGCGFCSQLCPENAILPLSINKLVAKHKTISRGASKVNWFRLIIRLRKLHWMNYIFDKIENMYKKQ